MEINIYVLVFIGIFWVFIAILYERSPAGQKGAARRRLKAERERQKAAQRADRERQKAAQRSRIYTMKADRKKRRLSNFIGVIRSDGIKGYKKVHQGDWIRVEADRRSDAENLLREKAAPMGFNVVTKLNYKTDEWTYVAGRGKAGNPYYRTAKSKEWEGLPLYVKKATSKYVRKKASKPKKLTARKTVPIATSENRKGFPNSVVVDGSNVMYWDGKEPSVGSVERVLKALIEQCQKVTVFFDSNVGYMLFDRLVDREELAQALGLDVERVTIVPGGVDADKFILQYAIQDDATIVSNDMFRDYPSLNGKVERVSGVIAGEHVLFDWA